MKIFGIFLLLSVNAFAQVPASPLPINPGRLVEVVLDAEKPVSYSISKGEFGLPNVDIEAYVTVETCLDSFPKMKDMMKSIGKHSVQLFVFDSKTSSTCIGFSSRPTVISINPGAIDPKETLLNMTHGQVLSVKTQTAVQDHEWVVTSVQITQRPAN